MPLYEYLCSNCAHRFERIVKFSDPPLTVCPKCGKPALEQVISAPAVQFKGSGWYVTDYAHKNPAGSNSSASRGDSGGDSGDPVESSAAAAKPASGEGSVSGADSKSASNASSDSTSSSNSGSSSGEGSSSSAAASSGSGSSSNSSSSSGSGDSGK